jgi:hypothetical protein
MSHVIGFSTVVGFIDGVGFDPFFRGLLSVLVGVVVLIGGSYLLLATNSGSRLGGLITAGQLFGWMFLMGLVWTVYAIGWTGEGESWALVEINSDNPLRDADGLEFAEDERVQELGDALIGFNLEAAITNDDPDLRQAEAVEISRENPELLADWRYLAASDPQRGEASASAEEFLIEEGVFGSTAEFVPLTYDAYNTGGKPRLDPDIVADDPDKSAWVESFTDLPARVWHKVDTSVIHFWHPQELVVIQFQGVVDEPTLPGEAPPVATADPDKNTISVIMERDRGGPIPALVGGTRVVPALFAIFNGILFAVISWVLHIRDRREQSIRAAVA